jgi:trehalose-phosphatase
MQPTANTATMQDVWRGSAVSALPPRGVMLVTDFDGTLAEIASDPGHAVILPESLAALRRLSGLLRRVAVLSSRPTAVLERLVLLRGADLIGDSGAGDLTAQERGRLDRFNLEAVRILSNLPGVWLEMKPGASAVHYRHAAVNADQLMTLLRPLLIETALKVLPGRRVIEVMPRDHPKGAALQSLIERRRPEGVICMGDDENDRPMFELVGGLDRPHLTVGVASTEAPHDLFVHCDLVLASPREASRFLTMLADWAAGTAQS